MSGINDEKKYMFKGENFFGNIDITGINVKDDKLTIPFDFIEKDDRYNIIAGLKVGYRHTYNNQSYVLKENKEDQSSCGFVREAQTPVYSRILIFEKN